MVYQIARVAELVDALDSKSCTFGCAGSIPASGTKKQSEKQSESEVGISAFFFVLIFILFPFLKRQRCYYLCFFLHSQFHTLSFFKAAAMLLSLLFSFSFSFSFLFLSKSEVVYSAFFILIFILFPFLKRERCSLLCFFSSFSFSFSFLFKAREKLGSLLFSSFSFSFSFLF